MNPTAPAQPQKIAPCPNQECEIPVKLRVERDTADVSDDDRYRVIHDYCGYSGPYASSSDEAIRLHNALCSRHLEPAGSSENVIITREISAAQYAQDHHAWDWEAIERGIREGNHMHYAVPKETAS